MVRVPEGLENFIQEMFNRGYRVTRMTASGEDVLAYKPDLDTENAHDVGYQALNFEQTWVRFENGDARQAAMVMYTGDKFCDVVPIADWTFQRDKPDVIKEIIDDVRTDLGY